MAKRPLTQPRVRWKARADGLPARFELVGDRLVGSVIQGRQSAIRAWSLDGAVLWSTKFDGLLALVAGANVFAEGAEALRVRVEDGVIVCRRRFERGASLRAMDRGRPVFRLGSDPRVPADGYVVLHPETLETVAEVPWGGECQFHDDVVCTHDFEAGTFAVADPDTWRVTAEGVLPIASDNPGWHWHFGPLWCHFTFTQRIGYNVELGRVQWQWEETGEWHRWWSPCRAGRRVFGHGRAGLVCYDLVTGAAVWRQPHGQDPAGLLGDAAFGVSTVGDVVWCSTGRSLYRLRITDGHILGHYRSPRGDVTQPVGLDEHRVVVAWGGQLWCIEFP